MAELLYLKLSESCLAEKRKVKIKDVATVLSPNPDIKYGVEKLELMSFSGSKEQTGHIGDVHSAGDTGALPGLPDTDHRGNGRGCVLQDI